MRTISPEARSAAHAEASDKVWLVLLEITATGLSTPIRVANDNVDVIHQGWTFIGYPFEVELPPESQDRPMIARIRIDNTERLIVDEVRTISEPPSVTLRVVLADQPDVIEVEYAGMRLRNVTWDAGEISGDLVYEDILSEPVCEQMTPARFPGGVLMIELPDWVSAYVGLPFKEGGRHREGLDCYGLLRLVINERFAGAVPEYEGIAYRPGEDRGLLAALMDERIRLWRLVAKGDEQPGDGVLLRVMGRPIHVGVMVAPGFMLHIEKNCDSVLERFTAGSRWERRVLGFYRHAA